MVSAAALVMVGVFSLFGTASSLDLKEAGVGLAVAVLLDATVVRGVLLPATMKLLGERNWYLPSWLAWLPRASLEGGVADAPDQRPDPEPALASVGPLTPQSVAGPTAPREHAIVISLVDTLGLAAVAQAAADGHYLPQMPTTDDARCGWSC